MRPLVERNTRPLPHGLTADKALKSSPFVTGIFFRDRHERHWCCATAQARWMVLTMGLLNL